MNFLKKHSNTIQDIALVVSGAAAIYLYDLPTFDVLSVADLLQFILVTAFVSVLVFSLKLHNINTFKE
jgi:hypothetical protein